MSVKHYQRLCHSHYGKFVRITDRTGRVHMGKIVKVTPNHVYILPRRSKLGGLGYGYWRRGWGYPGFYRPYAIPFSFITGLVAGAAFSRWW